MSTREKGSENQFTVQAVTQAAGITAHTLRAWESRHGAVSPARSNGGQRLYDQKDLNRLKLLAALTRRGHRIGALASLSTERLGSLFEASLTAAQNPRAKTAEAGRLPDYILPRFQEATLHLKNFELVRLAKELKWMRTTLGSREFVLEVVSPLLALVGAMVAEKKMNIVQEHAFSAILRDQLGDLLESLQMLREDSHQSTHLFAAPEGDLHEFGIMLGAVLGATYGTEIAYLGPNLPARDLAIAAKHMKSDYVILGNSPCAPDERKIPFTAFIEELDSLLPQHVEIWIGGQGERPKQPPASGRKIRYLRSLHELDALLERHSRQGQ